MFRVSELVVADREAATKSVMSLKSITANLKTTN